MAGKLTGKKVACNGPAEGGPVSTRDGVRVRLEANIELLEDLEYLNEYGAEGVIFAAPSFCDPALLDRPMLENALDRVDVPHIGFKYAENSAQMQPVREQAGTFADSIKLWSAA